MLRRAVLLSVVVASPVMAQSRPVSPAPVETKSRGATVEGDVYLLTKGGDVKVGAANEIALLQITDDLRTKWESLCESQKHAVKINPNRDFDAFLAQANAERRERVALLKKAATSVSPTGMKGHYEFRDLTPGQYWLFAEMVLMDKPYWWLHPIELQAGDIKRIDLDNSRTLEKVLSCDQSLP